MNNEDLQRRLDASIPGGCHTYSKGRDVFPENAPSVLVRGKGCYVWDPAGTRYLDFGMGLKSVILGYADKSVNSAVKRAMRLGNNLSRPSFTELLAAEELIELIPCAEMVKFAKNGSNVTTAAVKLSRVATQRKLVAVPREHPFFSFDDWFIGVTNVPTGIPKEYSSLTRLFTYGDLDSLRYLFDSYPDEIACVMLEPAIDLLPCEEPHQHAIDDCLPFRIQTTSAYLVAVKDLCKKNSAVLIFDETRTGFRWRLGGAQDLFGVTPDLATFGKSMANGYSVSALVGVRNLMELASTNVPGSERTFLLSSTNGAEIISLEAFRRTHREITKRGVIEHIWAFGAEVAREISRIIEDAGWSSIISLQGSPVSLSLEFQSSELGTEQQIRTKFYSLLAREHILMPSLSQSAVHGSKEMKALLEAATLVLEEFSNHAAYPAFFQNQDHLLRPVFRPVN